MRSQALLLDEMRGALRFFLEHTNRHEGSPGYGLTADSTKRPDKAVIAGGGFALTAWVIVVERGLLEPDEARRLAHGTLNTLSCLAARHRGFYAHFLRLGADLARRLYRSFRCDIGDYVGLPIIINPGGSLFAYQFSEAWLDTARLLNPDGANWFENTRRAALANRTFGIENARRFKTYHARGWGLSAGDSPHGYDVFGAPPCLGEAHHDGTVSICAAVACLPFLPDETLEMMTYLYHHQLRIWGPYGFYDAYNLDVSPPWYSRAVYAINKGCSLLMIENCLSGPVWGLYAGSLCIRQALEILGFMERGGRNTTQDKERER